MARAFPYNSFRGTTCFLRTYIDKGMTTLATLYSSWFERPATTLKLSDGIEGAMK